MRWCICDELFREYLRDWLKTSVSQRGVVLPPRISPTFQFWDHRVVMKRALRKSCSLTQKRRTTPAFVEAVGLNDRDSELQGPSEAPVLRDLPEVVLICNSGCVRWRLWREQSGRPKKRRRLCVPIRPGKRVLRHRAARLAGLVREVEGS